MRAVTFYGNSVTSWNRTASSSLLTASTHVRYILKTWFSLSNEPLSFLVALNFEGSKSSHPFQCPQTVYRQRVDRDVSGPSELGPLETKWWMRKISWVDRISSEEVLPQLNETQTMLKSIRTAKHRRIGHVLQHDVWAQCRLLFYCTKCNGPPIKGHCTNHYSVPITIVCQSLYWCIMVLSFAAVICISIKVFKLYSKTDQGQRLILIMRASAAALSINWI